MSSVICSICLERVKSPVCCPCGHIHCEGCLNEAIDVSDGSSKANCPTCRAPFYITPTEKVPTKYHRYVYPSTRRIYLDEHSDGDLHAKVADLESRLVKVMGEKTTLLTRLEAAQKSVESFRYNQEIANLEIKDLRHKRLVWERKCASAEDKYNKNVSLLEKAKEDLASERKAHEQCKAECMKLRQMLEPKPKEEAGKKRKRSEREEDDSPEAQMRSPKRRAKAQPLRTQNMEIPPTQSPRSQSSTTSTPEMERPMRALSRSLSRRTTSFTLSVTNSGGHRSVSVRVD